MARSIPSLYTLNRGVVDRRALARMDVKRVAMAAEIQTNWLPKQLGPMFLRPGTLYLGDTLNDAQGRNLKFIFATDDTARLELTDGAMRVWIKDALLTRAAVATTVTNGEFVTDLTGWTGMDEAGAASTWVSSVDPLATSGYMQLWGTGTARAIREQHVTCASPRIEHALRIVIARGPVTLRVGSTSGDDDYVDETVLFTGTHSLSFTPTGDFYVRFFSSQAPFVWVDSCEIEAAGVVQLPTPWALADLDSVRYDQSGDVLFVACAGIQQRRIERRGTRPDARGWSVVLYQSPDGPFLLQNTGPITLQPSGISGDIQVVASAPLFKSTQVGALYSVTSVGQQTSVAASAANTFSNAIRVTGLSAQRGLGIRITGTFSATVVLQQSFDNAVWSDVPGQSWTADVSTSYNDGLDNQIVFYRIGIEATYASGTAACLLSFTAGSIRGVFRITQFVDSQTVYAEVLTSLGGTAASAVWEEGTWSDKNGWPTSVVIHEGRMWWAGQNGILGSISDAYDSFDETFLGDAGPINRTIGSGPVDSINWLLSLKGLLLGAPGAEYSVRSSALDEPLTPTNFNLKASATQGSGNVAALKVDQSGYFVDRTNAKVFELAFDVRAYDYVANDLMTLCPEIGLVGIVRLDVQRKPETRFHAVLADGTVLVGIINRQEDVLAWVPVVTAGLVEDVCVLPALAGNLDDEVTYIVNRTINGQTVRFHEKWAQEIDCRGDKAQCFLADAAVGYSGAATTSLPVAHLEGQSVVVWAGGVDLGTDDSVTPWEQRYTVSGGVVTLPNAVTDAVVGLGYTATFQSAKLGTQTGPSPLNQQKKINHIGLVMADVHRKGVQYGPSFDYLDDMPLIEDGALVTAEVSPDYDQNLIEFPGTWTTDMRVCLLAQAPRPATIMAVTIDEEQNS